MVYTASPMTKALLTLSKKGLSDRLKMIEDCFTQNFARCDKDITLGPGALPNLIWNKSTQISTSVTKQGRTWIITRVEYVRAKTQQQHNLTTLVKGSIYFCSLSLSLISRVLLLEKKWAVKAFGKDDPRSLHYLIKKLFQPDLKAFLDSHSTSISWILHQESIAISIAFFINCCTTWNSVINCFASEVFANCHPPTKHLSS